MSVPITMYTKTYSPVMLIAPGKTNVVNAAVTVDVGKTEGTVQPPTDYGLIIDNSGSTAGIMEQIKEAGEKVIANLRPEDRICIISFNTSANVVLDWVNGDAAGKSRARTTLWNIRSTGGTAFSTGLQLMLAQFANTPAGREKRGLFLTDGENGEKKTDPTTWQRVTDYRTEDCVALKNAGVTVFFGGLGVSNQDERGMEQMAEANSVKTNFRGLTTPDDIMQFFAEMQAAAAISLIKNGSLHFQSIEGVQILNFELVLRAKQLNYVAEADSTRRVVKFGDMGREEQFDFFVCIQVTQSDKIVEGMNSFGKLELWGEEAGGNTQSQFAKGYLRVQYVKVLPPNVQADAEVKEIMGLAAAQRELAQGASATDPVQAAEHFAKAEEAVRKTRPFNRGAALNSLADSLKQAAAAQTPEQKQQIGRRATTRFSATSRLRDMQSALKQN